MRATKLVSVALAALLGVSLMSTAFASPFEKSNGDEIDTTKSRGTGNSTAPTFTTHLIKYATDSSDDSKWGGAVFKQPPSGSFKAIQGSFTVPKASLPAGQAFILAGIGGTNGSNNYWLQVGIFINTTVSGAVDFKPVHVLHPISNFIFDDAEIGISEGDSITLRVETYSTNQGVAIIENHSTGKGMHKLINAPPGASPLLGQHAEWFVAQPAGQLLTNFGSVKFSDCVVYTNDGQNYGPEQGSFIAYIRDGEKNMTETVVRGHGVSITYSPKTQSHTRDIVSSGGAASFSDLYCMRQLSQSTTSGFSAPGTSYNPFGGAQKFAPDGNNFTAASGRFVIPALRAGSPPNQTATDYLYELTIGVGIESPTVIYETTLRMVLNATTGKITVHGVIVAIPATIIPLSESDLVMSVGDTVTLRVVSISQDSGTFYIENETTQKTFSNDVSLNDTWSLGGTESFKAYWQVQALNIGGQHNLPDFGEINFTNCHTSLHNRTELEGLAGATPIFIKTNDTIASDVYLDDDHVNIIYNRHQKIVEPATCTAAPPIDGVVPTTESASIGTLTTGVTSSLFVGPPKRTNFTVNTDHTTRRSLDKQDDGAFTATEWPPKTTTTSETIVAEALLPTTITTSTNRTTAATRITITSRTTVRCSAPASSLYFHDTKSALVGDKLIQHSAMESPLPITLARAGPLVPSSTSDGEADGKSGSRLSGNWAGALIELPPPGTFFTSVSGTFTVPGASAGLEVGEYCFAIIWVGIGESAILQAGIQLTFNASTSETTVTPVHEFFPDPPPHVFNGITVLVGDVVSVRVQSSTSTAGTVYIENLTTQKSVSKELSLQKSDVSLKGHTVEWIVECPTAYAVANFGTVIFTDIKATTNDSTIIQDLGDAASYKVLQHGKILTDVVMDAKQVTIKYNPRDENRKSKRNITMDSSVGQVH